MSLPPQVKAYKRFLVQANRVEKVDPVVAYYCRLHVVMGLMGLEPGEKDATVMGFLDGLLQKLERTKTQLQLDQDSDRGHLRQFAENLFDRADTDDRSAQATMQTSHAFMTAAVLYEVLQVFGPVFDDVEIHNKIRYAQWKAVDISKALKEGRAPAPGGFGAAVEAEAVPQGDMDVDPAEPQQPFDMVEPDDVDSKTPEPAKPVLLRKPTTPGKPRAPKNLARLKQLNRAEVLTREALSAIRFSDTATGIAKLAQALETLQ